MRVRDEEIKSRSRERQEQEQEKHHRGEDRMPTSKRFTSRLGRNAGGLAKGIMRRDRKCDWFLQEQKRAAGIAMRMRCRRR